MAPEKDNNSTDQDELAKEWENALAEQGGDDSDSGQSDSGGGQAQDDLAEEWAKALADEEEQKMSSEKESSKATAGAQDFDFKDISQEKQPTRDNEANKRDLEFIMDIPLNVAAELGRSKLLINDLLQLGQGSVIELDKLAGEPLEILVNGKLVARGEAVVINEKFGVRLTDIISPMERVKQLG